MSFPLLTATALVPAIGALAVAAVPAARRESAKWLALGVSVVTLALAAVVALRFEPGGDRYQLTESYAWIPEFGVRYELGVDGIGVAMVVLTALLIPFLIGAAWRETDPETEEAPRAARVPVGAAVGAGGGSAGAPPAGSASGGAEGAAGTGGGAGGGAPSTARRRRPTQTFFALVLAVEAMVVMAFAATDIFLFYLFFEAMLIPMYFLIGGFGDRAGGRSETEENKQRSYAAVKFLLYNLAGGLIMLAALIGLYVATADLPGGATFSLQAITEAREAGEFTLAQNTERLLFLGFFVAFAVKAPLWPLHTWLPNAMGESTPSVAVLITAVVDKVGTFAMLRFCLGLFPGASEWATPVVIALALVSIVYGALLALGQRDMKRLIAYASVSHFGFIVLGIFAMTSQGQTGAVLYMVNHGIATAILMLVAGFLIQRRGSRLIGDYGGVQKTAPILAGAFLVGGLATLSLPGTGPFVSEFLVLVGTFTRYPVAGVIACAGILLAALYVLVLYQRTMTGPVRPELERTPDLGAREIAVVGPLIALVIALGVFPKPVADTVEPAVEHTLSDVEHTDPAPELDLEAQK